MNLLQYSFFQNALVGSLLASILCGFVGTYVVTRRLVFVSGGITHASFGGVGLGVWLGLPPTATAAVFSVLTAFGIRWLSGSRNMREDSAIAIFWTLGMSVGIICTFLTPGFVPELSSYLFGNILTIMPADLWFLCALSLVAACVYLFFLRTVVSVAFDPVFARSMHLPVAWVEYGMMAFVALTVVACLRMVGIVLMISLLTIPQVTANLFTNDFRKMALLSVAFGYAACLGGLAFSCAYNVPSGATIIFVSAIIYIICKAGCVWFLKTKTQ